MKKVVHLGFIKNVGQIFCKIEVEGSQLSISGVEGPKKNGDCVGSCGQIIMSYKEYDKRGYHTLADIVLAPEWNRGMLQRFFDVWNRWHLNGMTAGSPAQEEWLRKHKDEYPGYSISHYDWACKELALVGLHPDPTYLKDGKPYKYGSAWLHEEVPKDVLEFLQSLPDSPVVPPWV